MRMKRESDFQKEDLKTLHRSFDGELSDVDLDPARVWSIGNSRDVAEYFQKMSRIRDMLRNWLSQEKSSIGNSSWDLWERLEPELRKIDLDRALKKERSFSRRLFGFLRTGKESRNVSGQAIFFGGFATAAVLVGFAFQIFSSSPLPTDRPLAIAQHEGITNEPGKFQFDNRLFASSTDQGTFLELNSPTSRGALSSIKEPGEEIVANNNEFAFDSLRTFPAQNRHFQVDWMRSRKPVSIVPAKRENVPPIIWVRNSR